MSEQDDFLINKLFLIPFYCRTDVLIQKSIRSLFKNCTVITVAHKTSTISDYDRIIVMDEGQIVESGDPSSVLEKYS